MDNYELLLQKLAKPAVRAIQNTGLKSLNDIAALSEKDFSSLHGIGKNAMSSVQQVLSENGLNFKK
jgi:hypothetical protein